MSEPTKNIISTINYNQEDIILDIINLHIPSKTIDIDPTFSKGNFYKSGKIPSPTLKFDLFPQTNETIASDAANLPIGGESVNSIMFDPPFIVGHTQKTTGIIATRFNSFRYIQDLWEWYDRCLIEFYRILKKNGVLIFKCQDTVSSGKQWLSHVHIINEAEKLGFYSKDIFILLAKNRIIGHNHRNQKHGRKFHSYFLVFEKH